MATVELPHYDLSIAGSPVPSAGGRFYDTVDPYTGEPWARVPDADEQDVDRAVAAARAAFEGEWGALTGFQRAQLMHRLADLIERDAERLAELESRDNGQAAARVHRPDAATCPSGTATSRAGRTRSAARACRRTSRTTSSSRASEPVGVVAAIVPWNSPLLLLTWKLAPALAAGCTMVIKPSDHTPVTALELAKLVTEAGFPAGVFNVITGNGPDVGRALVRHPGVDKVAFTGSTKTGIDVAEGATSHLARVTLELGGKSAQVVFADADLEAAANGVIAGVFAATGQTCMAGSRLVVHEDVHDELVERIAERARTIVLGNPLEPDTEMGPLANAAQFEKVTGILDAAQREGATAVCGGGPDRSAAASSSSPRSSPASTPTRPRCARRSSGRCERHGLHRRGRGDRARPTTPTTGSRPACGRSTSAAPMRVAAPPARRHGLDQRLPRRRRRTCRSAASSASGIGRENGSEVLREYLETKAVWVEPSGATRDPFVLG